MSLVAISQVSEIYENLFPVVKSEIKIGENLFPRNTNNGQSARENSRENFNATRWLTVFVLEGLTILEACPS